jgi:2-phosphosulfolactate phosphatase
MLVTAQLVPGGPPPGRDQVAVVIDVIRATTSLTVALAHGATRIIPVGDVEEARAIAARTPGAILCGERGGCMVPGYDMGNSPPEFAAERMRGATLVFASTNGSPALIHAAAARERIPAAFINATAVVERVARAKRLVLVCAGALGHFALEDTACAGWIARALRDRGARLEGAEVAMAVTLAPTSRDEVRTVLQGSYGGRALRRQGKAYAADVEFCAELDSLPQAFAI